jgi:hypothetical protein
VVVLALEAALRCEPVAGGDEVGEVGIMSRLAAVRLVSFDAI